MCTILDFLWICVPLIDQCVSSHVKTPKRVNQITDSTYSNNFGLTGNGRRSKRVQRVGEGGSWEPYLRSNLSLLFCVAQTRIVSIISKLEMAHSLVFFFFVFSGVLFSFNYDYGLDGVIFFYWRLPKSSTFLTDATGLKGWGKWRTDRDCSFNDQN